MKVKTIPKRILHMCETCAAVEVVGVIQKVSCAVPLGKAEELVKKLKRFKAVKKDSFKLNRWGQHYIVQFELKNEEEMLYG